MGGGQLLAAQTPALAAEVAQHVDGPPHLAVRLGEGLALLPRQVPGHGLGPRSEDFRGVEQDGAAGR